MKTFTAHTSEVDDSAAAVAEILSQIDLKELQANTIGIIICHYEFVFSGVVEAVCNALPFSVTGTISSVQASDEMVGVFDLALMVLTGDDVYFKTVLTDSLLDNPDAAISAAYTNAVQATAAAAAPATLATTTAAAPATSLTAKLDGQPFNPSNPNMIFIHGPFIPSNSGDRYLQTVNQMSNGCPLFGVLAVDDTDDFRHSYVIYNGAHYTDRLVLTLIYGAINPRFYVANISPNMIVGDPALITSSDDQMLKTINGRPVCQYFADLGLAEASETQYAMSSLPFFLDYGDGTPPISRVFIMFTPDGDAILSGSAPEGLTLTVAAFNKEDVLLTTKTAIDQILSDAQARPTAAVLSYSCIARNMSLGAEHFLEAELVREHLKGKVPYLMGYAGGEFSPMNSKQETTINRFHNNTFIACVL